MDSNDSDRELFLDTHIFFSFYNRKKSILYWLCLVVNSITMFVAESADRKLEVVMDYKNSSVTILHNVIAGFF